MTDTPQSQHLASTALIDSAHPAVQAFAQTHSAGNTDRERAVSLYYAVRDGFRYDPYRIDLSSNGMRASQVIANGYGWCVPKSALMCAAARAAGISARVGYADVRNHLSTAPHARDHEDRHLHLARLCGTVDRRCVAQGHAGLQH
jgi:transglutaminase-like putative cysteine protease